MGWEVGRVGLMQWPLDVLVLYVYIRLRLHVMLLVMSYHVEESVRRHCCWRYATVAETYI